KAEEIEEDIEYIIKKLRITRQVWDEEIMGAPLRTYADYPSSERRIQRFRTIKHLLKGSRSKSGGPSAPITDSQDHG
ncbi:MAG: hypothetical protein D6800_01525, partial [Candidatus Zixiibacteriota bacterium]